MRKESTKFKLISDFGHHVKYLVEWKGQTVFLKVRVGSKSGEYYWAEELWGREKIALSELQHFAVPKQVKIPKSVVQKWFNSNHVLYSALELLPGTDCNKLKLTVPQGIGLWAFMLEHLCAFHREGIMYVDLKPAHLIIESDLSAAHIIDFDRCVLVEPSGVYDMTIFVMTTNYMPPENLFMKTFTERTIVYQAGMVLGALLGWGNDFINQNLSEAIPEVKKQLFENRCGGIANLLDGMLSANPSERPKDLESTFAALNMLELPAESVELWSKLRAPYRQQLAKLKLIGPVVQLKKVV
jgi:serine/threonine protein kinase